MSGSPRITVFTAARDARYLDDALRSLQAQTFVDWQWVIVLPLGVTWSADPPDARCEVVNAADLPAAAKRRACTLARGDFLVHLDHEDELRSDALDLLVAAFDAHPSVGAVYSNSGRPLDGGDATDSDWDEANGWRHCEVAFDDRKALAVQSLEAYPHNISYVWFAPTHVLAFRRSVFEQAGGYDADRELFDDQELICRIYELADLHHIDECLYLERWPQGDAHPSAPRTDVQLEEVNARIEEAAVALYDSFVQRAALAWSRRRGLLALDLGAAHNKPDGYLGVDQYPGEAVDIVADVSKGLDLPDSSVGVIRAADFLEHITDKVGLFNELHRVLAHGGMLLSLTPSTDGRGAYQDPTHVAFYNENSFWYFTDDYYRQFVPELTCRFQVSRLKTFFPSDWHEQRQIPYVCANLIAIKDGPRQGGLLKV